MPAPADAEAGIHEVVAVTFLSLGRPKVEVSYQFTEARVTEVPAAAKLRPSCPVRLTG